MSFREAVSVLSFRSRLELLLTTKTTKRTQLEAIYGEEAFSAVDNVWKVVVESSIDLSLSLTIPKSYPLEAPPLAMTLGGKGAGGEALACWRLGQLMSLSKESIGRPMVYEMVSWLQTEMAELKTATSLAVRVPPQMPQQPSESFVARLRGWWVALGWQGRGVTALAVALWWLAGWRRRPRQVLAAAVAGK